MDPGIIGGVASEFIKQGTLGLIIVVLLGVCIALWRAYEGAHKARLTDAKDFIDKYVVLLEKSMTAQKDTSTILEVIKERVSQGRQNG